MHASKLCARGASRQRRFEAFHLWSTEAHCWCSSASTEVLVVVKVEQSGDP